MSKAIVKEKYEMDIIDLDKKLRNLIAMSENKLRDQEETLRKVLDQQTVMESE